MKRIIIIILFGVLFLGGCSFSEKETDALKFKREYEEYNGKKIKEKMARKVEIDENNSVVYLSVQELIEKMKGKESFVLYLGFPECPWCRSVISTLLEVVDDVGIEKVYYINIRNMRDSYEIKEGKAIQTKKGTEDYQTLLRLFDSVLDDYTLKNESGEEVSVLEKRIYAPSIISVVDGKVESLTDGISDKQLDAFMELNDEIKGESYDKIKCSIECVANVSKVCGIKKC